jgi:uncharacterized surface protein with fasciclin (FAS1) repeats
MSKKLQLLLPMGLRAALVAGMMFASSSGSIVEVEQELPIRAALERRPSSPGVLGAPEEVTYPGDLPGAQGRGEDAEIVSTPDTNVIDTALKFEKFGMFVKAAKAAGLIDELRSAEGITIFMPTNSAFAHLPGPFFEDLLKPENKATLRNLVSAHIVPATVVWSELFGRKTRLTTISGKSLISDGANGVRVNGVRLELSDVLATNGVIHVVDQLFRPAAVNPSVM